MNSQDIFDAARDGDLARVKELVASGGSVNSRGLNGKTPLHWACEKGHLALVQYLVEQGADMNATDNYGRTPLRWACVYGHLAVVQYLRELGAEINAQDNYGWTPLHMASGNGHLEVVQYLKKQGADINTKNKYGWTPLPLACQKGHLEVVQYLKEQGADICTKDKDGWTPLYWACWNGHLEVVQYLKEQGADMNAESKNGRTPLHRACENGHLEVVQYLKEQGAVVNATDNYGGAPLHMACENGHLAVVQYLLEQGAEINATDKSGRTALDVSRDDRIRTLLRGTTASAPVAVTADSKRIVSAARTEDGELRGLLHGMFPADLPLLTLLDSLIPIRDSHPDIAIARQVQLAERKAVQLAARYGTLSSHERAAIVLYTMEAIPRETSVYFMMNAALRKVDREAVWPWRDYIWLLLHALRKLPAITMDTNLYRGMKVSMLDLGNAYVEGSEFQWAGFSSTSMRVKVMESEHFLGRSGSRVLFNLKLTEPVGRDISDFSLYREAEILLPPNMMFKVTSVLDAGNDLHYLQCEQTQSLDMLLDFLI